MSLETRNEEVCIYFTSSPSVVFFFFLKSFSSLLYQLMFDDDTEDSYSNILAFFSAVHIIYAKINFVYWHGEKGENI